MLELYQAEWCPHSHRVRQRLTELGLDFVARQVPADPRHREELARIAGISSIPVLIPADGSEPLAGERAILAYLETRFEERPDAAEHRAKALEEVPTFAELEARGG